MLIIELASRRRIRINGMVSSFENNIVQIKVYESYPNCMKIHSTSAYCEQKEKVY